MRCISRQQSNQIKRNVNVFHASKSHRQAEPSVVSESLRAVQCCKYIELADKRHAKQHPTEDAPLIPLVLRAEIEDELEKERCGR
jgi:hypothetical protein